MIIFVTGVSVVIGLLIYGLLVLTGPGMEVRREGLRDSFARSAELAEDVVQDLTAEQGAGVYLYEINKRPSGRLSGKMALIYWKFIKIDEGQTFLFTPKDSCDYAIRIEGSKFEGQGY